MVGMVKGGFGAKVYIAPAFNVICCPSISETRLSWRFTRRKPTVV